MTPHYRVRLLPREHQLEVALRLTAPHGSLELQVPTWVPGAYAFMRYGRDLYDLKARAVASGEVLAVSRHGWQGFRLDAPGGEVEVTYRVYAHDPSWGELTGLVDDEHAILLGTHYLFAPSLTGPCVVEYELPNGWALHHPGGARRVHDTVFEYPSYAALLDAPVIAGAFERRTRTCDGTPIHHVFVDRAVGFESEVESFIDRVMRTVEGCRAMFGSFPFADYTFVYSFNPTSHWGLEHAHSTMVGIGENALIDPDARSRAVRVCAHELFHAWNVCRLKPAALSPPDFARGSFPDGLWVSEGFTRYYEFLFLARAGELSAEGFFSNVVNYYRHLCAMPAYQRVNVADSSQATFLNHNKYPGSINNTIDFYDHGMLVAFDADVALRTAASPSSLDRAFAEFYSEYVTRPNGFTSNDVIESLGARAPGLRDQLRREVFEAGSLSVPESLTKLGFAVETEHVRYLGLVLDKNQGPEIVNVLEGSPAGNSGIAPGDLVLKINGFPFSLLALKWLIAQGSSVALEVRRGHRSRTFTVAPGSREQIASLVWNGSDAQRDTIRGWLGRQDFAPAQGKSIPLSSFENFHGIQTVY